MSNSKSNYKIIACLESLQFWFVDDLEFHIKKSICSIEYFSNGSKEWYKNDLLHREDGPVIEHSDGSKHWYLNGKPHRKDGPAIENFDGSKFWYLNGKKLSEKEFKELKNKT